MDRRGPDGEGHGQRVNVEDVGRVGNEVRAATQARVRQGGVHGADRQDRRKREAPGVEAPIREDHHLGTPLGGGDRRAGESLQGALETRLALERVPGRHQPLDRTAGVADLVEEPVEIRDDRPGEMRGGRRPGARRSPQERGPAPELDPQVHDDPLALRIDRRIGDLGERLAQVVGNRAVHPRAARRGRVVAHAPQRLVAFEGHRLDVQP